MAKVSRQQDARLPRPPRDRRTGLAVLAVLLMLVGGLTSALFVYRSGDRVDVLVATRDLHPGQRITEEDLTIARVANDGGTVVPASMKRAYVGSQATTLVPQGTLINSMMFTTAGVVDRGSQLVGVPLTSNLRPGNEIQPGDVVRLFYVAGGKTNQAATVNGQVVTPGTAVADAVRVVTVERGSSGDGVVVTVLVGDRADRGALVGMAAAGQLAVTKLPADTKPEADLRR